MKAVYMNRKAVSPMPAPQRKEFTGYNGLWQEGIEIEGRAPIAGTEK